MIWILALILAAGLGWLAVIIVQHNLELRAVQNAASALSEGQIEHIYRLIEQIGSSPSKGFIGILRELPGSLGELRLRLPEGIPEYPWGGLVVQAVVAPGKSEQPVTFIFMGPSEQDGNLRLCAPRWLAIPTIETANKKRLQSVYATDRYMRLSPDLAQSLRDYYPRNPHKLLTQLLSVHPRAHLSEPFDQLRCGLAAAWIQAPRFHKCSECGRPMRLILQVPGMLLQSRYSEGTFYHFGCASHPDITVTDHDWS